MGLGSYIGDALSSIPGVDPVARALGLKDSKADDLSKAATTAIGPSNENAQNAYNLALQQAQDAGAYQAPAPIITSNVNAPMITSGIASGVTSEATQGALAQRGDAVRGYSAAEARAASALPDIQGYNAYTGTISTAKPAAAAAFDRVDTNITAPQMAEAALAAREAVGKTYIDQQANDLRASQVEAANKILNGPSSAQAQFRAAMGQATDDALSVAAQARGNDRAGARREAIIQMAQKGAIGAQAAAATAAQEQTAKLQAYNQALQNVRGTDVTLAQTQAQIDSQRNVVQAQLNAATEQGNAAAINTLNQRKAELDMAAKQASLQAAIQQQQTQANVNVANMSDANKVAMANAQTITSGNLANAAARTKAASDLAEAQNAAAREAAAAKTNVSVANAGNATKASADYAAAQNLASQNYANAMNDISKYNAGLAASRAEANAGRLQQAEIANAGNQTSANTAQGQAQLSASTSNAGNQLKAGETNVSANLEAEKIRNAAETAGVSGMNQAAGIQGSNAAAVIGAQKAAAEEQTKSDTALIGAAGSVGAAAASDIRVKEDVAEVSDKEIDDLARRLNAYTWRYKEGTEDSGKHVHGGLMAQEVEKSPLGKNFVHEDSDGTKKVDVLSLAALMAAAAARTIRQKKERGAT